MNYPRAWVGYLLAGFLGGALGAWIFAVVFSHRMAVPAPLVSTIRSGTPSEFSIAPAFESIVALIKRDAGASFASLSRITGTAVALTADGLLATPIKIKNTAGLIAVPKNGAPFPVRFAKDKDGAIMSMPELGLTFLQAASAEALRISPATFAPFEEIAMGESVFALDSRRQLSWHRIIALQSATLPGEPVSSETIPKSSFRVDGELSPGMLLFSGNGKMIGLASSVGNIIPAEFIAHLLHQYLKNNSYRTTVLGINFVDAAHLIALTPESPSFGLVLTNGRGSPAVLPNSAASKAGLRAGDVLVSFDGQRLDGAIPFQLLLARYSPGTEVEIVLMRNGKEEKVKVVLEAK